MKITHKFRAGSFSGVYLITFPGTDKFYVGSSLDIPQREREHRYAFRYSRHSKKLQAAYDEAGGRWDLTPISQEFTDLFELRAAEANIIDLMYEAKGCLNTSKSVAMAPQRCVSAERRKRMSEDRTEEWRDRKDNYRGGDPRGH